MELSFAEQIKIILKRNNMTIQDLAELFEARTGTKMTRQNLSQRLRRDNFPEQDMRQLAAMLGYDLSIQLTPSAAVPLPMQVTAPVAQPVVPQIPPVQSQIPLQPQIPPQPQNPLQPAEAFVTGQPKQVTTADGSKLHIPTAFQKPVVQGDINPLTGEEYLSNTVRTHPSLEDYVQVYDRSTHEWIDVNEDYFWQFQANKKQILGKDYQEPILI